MSELDEPFRDGQEGTTTASLLVAVGFADDTSRSIGCYLGRVKRMVCKPWRELVVVEGMEMKLNVLVDRHDEQDG